MYEFLIDSLFQSGVVSSWLATIIVTTAFIMLPILAAIVVRKFVPGLKYAASGVVFGIIAIPLSWWLYLHFFVGPLRALVLGMLGVTLVWWHSIFFEKPDTISFAIVVDIRRGFWFALQSISLIQMLFWVIFYGLLGFLVDNIFMFKKKPSSNHPQRAVL